MFDLRSDTVTKPNKDIISTALTAELGDDEYAEDKTVNDLQEHCANLLGFESGLFVTSGLQGNQISLLIHTDPGNEVVTLFDSHIKNYEHGAASFLSRIQFRDIDHVNGLPDLNTLDLILKKSKVHKPLISCLTLENTHLASGGSIVSYKEIEKIYKFAKTNKLNVHIDGARIWHAIIEENNAQDYGSVCDSLTFCFSKGLGAPIGSMLLGSKDFISKAREYRKILGGGMRQVGVIAAMARKALDNRNELLYDHNKASKVYKPLISCLTLENTHLSSGGSIVSYIDIEKIYKFAKTNKLNVHIDGARIWHAIIEENNAQDYGSVCDSLTFCFSKGLGAPIGSMLLGSKDFISKAREYRKILGGGMRQVGVIAAMARKALDNRNELLYDHNKASKVYKNLKNEFENQDFISKLTYQGTNMVFLEINNQFKPELFLDELYNNSIIAGLINENTVRLVFHKDINDTDLETISEKILYSSSKFSKF